MGNHHGEPDWSVYQSGRPLPVGGANTGNSRGRFKQTHSDHRCGVSFSAQVLPRGTVSMVMEVDNGPWSLGTPETGLGLDALAQRSDQPTRCWLLQDST